MLCSGNRNGRVNPAIPLGVLLLMLAAAGVWLAFADKSPAFPERPGIDLEDFGSGIRIGQSLEDARRVKLPEKSAVQLTFMTLEDLANRNLYKDHSKDNDLIGVIHSSSTDTAATIQGLRCYLGGIQAEGERATLNDQFAANLGLDEVKQMYGKPFSETPEQSGRSHLVYYFADPTNEGLAFKLTTSHDYTGKVFSMALEQVLAPQ